MSDSKPQVFAEILEFDAGEEIRRSIMELNVDLKKESQQLPDDKMGMNYVEPSPSFDALLTFFRQNIYHRQSCKLKAVMVAGLGWGLVTEDENKEEDLAYKKIKALLDTPNSHPTETFTELCYRALIDYQAVGNLFLEVPRKMMSGEVNEIFHVRAKTMRRDNSLKKGYWQLMKGKRTEFRGWGQPPTNPVKNEILHFLEYDPENSHYGNPDWYPALAEMILDRNVIEYEINLFLNQLMAKFIIIVEGGQLSPTAKTSLQNYLSKNFHGLSNAGRTIILASDDPQVNIRIEKLEISFGDKEGFKGGTRQVSRNNVLAAHRVPPRLFGIIDQGGLGGGSENEGQLTVFKQTVIDPEQQRFEEFLNNTIIKSFGEHKWKLKFKEFDVTNLSSLADALTKLTGNGTILDENEAREIAGYAAREEDAKPNGNADDELDDVTKSVKALRERIEKIDG